MKRTHGPTRDRQSEPQRWREPDELASWLLRLAYARATQRGLVGADAEDCAAAFTFKMWERGQPALRADLDWPDFVRRAARCADNFAIDFGRAVVRRGAHLSGLSEGETATGVPAAIGGCLGGEDPETALLREEFARALAAALARLPAPARELLIRHHLGGEAVCDLANASGKSQGAIKQALYLARRRLRALLGEAGLTEAELTTHLAYVQRL